MNQCSKKVIVVILIALSLLALAACSSSSTPVTTLASKGNPPTLTPNPYPVAGPTNPAIDESNLELVESAALAYNPADGSLLKADQQGLARWQAGRGWEDLAVSGAAGLSSVVINPTTPTNIYIAGSDIGVSRSDDAGANWQEINYGLPSRDITALAIHSSRYDTLYAWVSNDGIYRTEDGGASWKKVPDVPIADPTVRDLTHSTLPGSMNTGWLYAATPSGPYLSMD